MLIVKKNKKTKTWCTANASSKNQNITWCTVDGNSKKNTQKTWCTVNPKIIRF